MSTSGIVFDVKELTVHDGPGIRTTVFLKGCPLSCKWCHNPEGISANPQLMKLAGCVSCGKCGHPCGHEECAPFDLCAKICPKNLLSVCGREVSTENIANKLALSESVFTRTGGGVTISGGEPLTQPEYLLELLERLAPIHRIVETSGFGSHEAFKQAAMLADEIYLDIKLADSHMHKKWCGVDNAPILKNLKWLIWSGKTFTARIPLIPGVSDSEENLAAAAALLKDAAGRVRVNLLPYNPLAGAKYRAVGQNYHPGFNETQKPAVFLKPFEEAGIACEVF